LHVGGAVAIDVAADAVYGSKVLAIIVENTFTSIPDMAVELVSPSVKYLPRICYKNKVWSTQLALIFHINRCFHSQYFSIDKIQFIASPILFISGLADTLVPPTHTLRLHNKCGSTIKRLFQIVGGSHNDTWAMNG
jgi:abhydrolase domain-containing protein 13